MGASLGTPGDPGWRIRVRDTSRPPLQTTDETDTDPEDTVPPRKSKRPNLRAYFAAQIDHHVNGMMARPIPNLPHDVLRVDGKVTSAAITVHMRDGSTWHWRGGQYATRKVNGCYAPLQPKPLTLASAA